MNEIFATAETKMNKSLNNMHMNLPLMLFIIT